MRRIDLARRVLPRVLAGSRDGRGHASWSADGPRGYHLQRGVFLRVDPGLEEPHRQPGGRECAAAHRWRSLTMDRTVLLALVMIGVMAGCGRRDEDASAPATAVSPPTVTTEPAPAEPAPGEPAPADSAPAEAPPSASPRSGERR